MSNFAIEHKSSTLLWWRTFLYKWNGGRGSILQQILPKLHNIVGKVLYNSNTSFSFLDIYRQICHFENDYHRFTAGFIKKSRHLKYQNAAFQKEKLVMNTYNSPGIMKLSSHKKISPPLRSVKLRSHMRGAVAERRRADFDISWGQWWFGARGFEAGAVNWVLDPFLAERFLLPLRHRSATAHVWTHVMICVEANFPPAPARVRPRMCERTFKVQYIYVSCQNGYRRFPHWVAQFRMEWTC